VKIAYSLKNPQSEELLMINQRLPSVVLSSPILLLILLNVIAQSPDRSKTLAEIASLKKQLNEKEKLFLSPSAEDKAAFADFLKQSNTGLIRLMPKRKYDDKLSMRGGGAYYSFTLLWYSITSLTPGLPDAMA
jgi:hypothetical protein